MADTPQRLSPDVSLPILRALAQEWHQEAGFRFVLADGTAPLADTVSAVLELSIAVLEVLTVQPGDDGPSLDSLQLLHDGKHGPQRWRVGIRVPIPPSVPAILYYDAPTALEALLRARHLPTVNPPAPSPSRKECG